MYHFNPRTICANKVLYDLSCFPTSAIVFLSLTDILAVEHEGLGKVYLVASLCFFATPPLPQTFPLIFQLHTCKVQSALDAFTHIHKVILSAPAQSRFCSLVLKQFCLLSSSHLCYYYNYYHHNCYYTIPHKLL